MLFLIDDIPGFFREVIKRDKERIFNSLKFIIGYIFELVSLHNKIVNPPPENSGKIIY